MTSPLLLCSTRLLPTTSAATTWQSLGPPRSWALGSNWWTGGQFYQKKSVAKRCVWSTKRLFLQLRFLKWQWWDHSVPRRPHSALPHGWILRCRCWKKVDFEKPWPSLGWGLSTIKPINGDMIIKPIKMVTRNHDKYEYGWMVDGNHRK